jgi:hypothetical protein
MTTTHEDNSQRAHCNRIVNPLGTTGIVLPTSASRPSTCIQMHAAGIVMLRSRVAFAVRQNRHLERSRGRGRQFLVTPNIIHPGTSCRPPVKRSSRRDDNSISSAPPNCHCNDNSFRRSDFSSAPNKLFSREPTCQQGPNDEHQPRSSSSALSPRAFVRSVPISRCSLSTC